MLNFGIPLRAKKTAKNWNTIEDLFNHTLMSIYNQSCPDFRIFVACHDIPTINFKTDERIEFIKADFTPPKNVHYQMMDKNLKRRLISIRLREKGGGFLMFVDADDLVSNRLAQHIKENREKNGFIINSGFEYDMLNNLIKMEYRFDKLCGSSSIVNWNIDELPSTIDDFMNVYSIAMERGHYFLKSQLAILEKPIEQLPFPGAIYVINTNENHSQLTGNIGWKRKILRRLFRGSKPTSAIKNEFSLK